VTQRTLLFQFDKINTRTTVADNLKLRIIVYIADPVKEALGRESVVKLAKALKEDARFENFVVSEEDLYGLKSKLDADEITEIVMTQVEALV